MKQTLQSESGWSKRGKSQIKEQAGEAGQAVPRKAMLASSSWVCDLLSRLNLEEIHKSFYIRVLRGSAEIPRCGMMSGLGRPIAKLLGFLGGVHAQGSGAVLPVLQDPVINRPRLLPPASFAEP